jgi:AraC-like DNA-binding protein
MLNSIDITDDECHGLADRPLRPGFSAIGLRAMLGTSTLDAALRVLSRYYAMTPSTFRLEVHEGGNLARISLLAESNDRPRAAMLEEIWLMALYMFMSWFAGRRLPLLAMSVARRDHPDIGGAHWAFGAPVSVSEDTSLLIPLTCLQLPRRVSDAEEPIWEAMRFWMDEVMPGPGEWVLGAAFSGAEAPAKTRLREAFEELELGDRQLSRRIRRNHGASFRDLRGDALAEIAKALLRNSEDSIEDIGVRLGYAEERSFRRFLRSRTGLTPAQIRKGAGVGATVDPQARSLVRSLVRKLQV